MSFQNRRHRLKKKKNKPKLTGSWYFRKKRLKWGPLIWEASINWAFCQIRKVTRLEAPAGKRERSERRGEGFPGSEGPRARSSPGACCEPTVHPSQAAGLRAQVRPVEARAAEGEGSAPRHLLLLPAAGRAGSRWMRPLSGRGLSRPTAGRSLGRPVPEGSPEAAPSRRPPLLGTGHGTAAHPRRAEGSGMGAEGGAGRGGGGCSRAPPPLSSSESGRRSAADPRPPSPPSRAAGRYHPRTEPSRSRRCCSPPRWDLRREGEAGLPGRGEWARGWQGPAVPGAAAEVSVCARPAELRRGPTRAPPATRPGRAGNPRRARAPWGGVPRARSGRAGTPSDALRLPPSGLSFSFPPSSAEFLMRGESYGLACRVLTASCSTERALGKLDIYGQHFHAVIFR